MIFPLTHLTQFCSSRGSLYATHTHTHTHTFTVCMVYIVLLCRFLAGSIGYLLLHFALAVDYLKIQTSTNQQRRLALSILQMFTRDNSQFKLPDSVRTPLLMGLLGNSEGMLEEVGLDKLFRCLRQAQSLVLAEVRSYWLRTFTECFEGHDRILSSAALSGVEGDQEVGGAKRAGSPFIHIQEDADGGGSATILPLPPLSSIDYDMSSTPTCDLGKPHCYGNSIPCTTPAEPSVPNQLKTLLPEKMSSSKETEQFELFPEEISDYLLSSLQCDSWAGSPLLEYLRMEGQSSTNTNCLLYWQGVQYLLLIDSHPSESRHNPLMHALLHTHLAPYACSVDMLIDQHIKMCGEKGVPLPTADRQCLLEYLPHGLGRGLLAASQRLTAKVCSEIELPFTSNCSSVMGHTVQTGSVVAMETLPPRGLAIILRFLCKLCCCCCLLLLYVPLLLSSVTRIVTPVWSPHLRGS